MGTIRAVFNVLRIKEVLDQVTEEQRQKQLDALIYLGNDFVTKARTNDTYTDHTGNLRSSIGFLIYENGKVLFENFMTSDSGTDREEGRKTGKQFALSHVKDNEMALIGVAGMNYAFFVEKKGYNVITGSAPTRNDVLDLLQ